MTEPGKRATSTSDFGVSRRESHDSSAFYARFTPPLLSDDDHVTPQPDLAFDDRFVLGDARDMHHLPDACVALVVTSPPYFVGKAYEADIARAEVPASYVEYLEMLRDVFAECVRVLEPGGRIAVNVANLGRKPYRSLSADIVDLLQDDLKLLLRGEVIWQKGKGATGSCAWGTFRSPANPVLRDITERVIIASKGRLDRALSPKERAARGLPHTTAVTNDEFLEATLDVWDIPAESARRVGHPAPFPAELPERLIELYTYEGDLVLDPFLGSGSTAVAAHRTGRTFVGYDLDPAYLDIARRRVAETTPRPGPSAGPDTDTNTELSAPPDKHETFHRRASEEGKAAPAIAQRVLEEAGFTNVRKNVRENALGLTLSYVADDQRGRRWNFDVSGAFTTTRGGLSRVDNVWKTLGRALVLREAGFGPHATAAGEGRGPVVLLTSHLPKRASEGDKALRKAGPEAVFDALEMLDDDDRTRLAAYATGVCDTPLAGFWSTDDLAAPDEG